MVASTVYPGYMSDDRVIDAEGQPIPVPDPAAQHQPKLSDLVEQPAKVMRIGGMIRQLLDEVKSAPLDDASRSRLREIHQRSIAELEDGLAPELVDELERLSLPFDSDSPSEPELRIAQAQLVGWLEGLFHGIQAALYAQQVQAQTQFANMRLALPQGQQQPADQAAPESTGGRSDNSSGGMYL